MINWRSLVLQAWFEGDNASVSLDSNTYGAVRTCRRAQRVACGLLAPAFSRAWLQVPIGLIKGRALSIIWPLGRLGWLESRIPRYRVKHANYRPDDAAT
jgi:hypothetical protein